MGGAANGGIRIFPQRLCGGRGRLLEGGKAHPQVRGPQVPQRQVQASRGRVCLGGPVGEGGRGEGRWFYSARRSWGEGEALGCTTPQAGGNCVTAGGGGGGGVKGR